MSRVGWVSAWPPFPSAGGLRRHGGVAFPLDRAGCRLFARARHGLFRAVPALGLRPGDEILVPAYHHGSEVEALVRARVRPVFYGSDDQLEPEAGELETLVGDRTRALYLIHPLGFPRDGARWRAWTADRGLLLIEDAAQAWLATTAAGEPVGSAADLTLFCLYKTVGIPDGAAVVATRPVPGPAGRRPAGLGAAAKKVVARAEQRGAQLGRRPGRDRGPYQPERDFDLGDPDLLPSHVTDRLLPLLGGPEPAARRRANYRVLLDRLGDAVTPAFADVPAGASPFAFPIRVADKERVLATLAGQGVLGLNLWSVAHPSLPAGRFPREAAWRAETVGLPVHQELTQADLDHVAGAALTALGVRP